MNRIIGITRTSASRPELLKVSTESLVKHLKFSGDLYIAYHEDTLNVNGSDECEKYLFGDASILFAPDIYKRDDPPVTQVMSLTWLIEQMDMEYFLNWEDDFEAVRDIDLDLACKIMDENPDVNQIAFHKRQTMSHRGTFIKQEVERSGVKLTTDPHWTVCPAIWRREFIMRYWIDPTPGAHPAWWINPIIKGRGNRNPQWIIDNAGHYFLGGIGELAYCYHLGMGKSLREGHYVFEG